MNKIEIRERTEDRREYGGSVDKTAINHHDRRVYEVAYQGEPRLFVLSCNLSGRPHFYELYWFHTDAEAERGYLLTPHHLTVRGKQYFGDGLGWEDAEPIALSAIETLMGSSDPFDLTRISTPPTPEWLSWFRTQRAKEIGEVGDYVKASPDSAPRLSRNLLRDS